MIVPVLGAGWLCHRLRSGPLAAETPNRARTRGGGEGRSRDAIEAAAGLDRAADHRRREASNAARAPNICASWRSTPVSSRRKIIPTDGVPGVFATLDAGAPDTLGIYFMYDVKQYDPAEWSSPPLEGADRRPAGEGKAIIGRGAVNQKGPETAFLAALHAFKATGRKLPVNLVLVAEGEEEIASPNFHQIVADPEVQAALKKAVGIFIPGRRPENRPARRRINLGAKGAVELQLISSGEKWGRGPEQGHPFEPAWRASTARPGAWSRRSTLGRRGRPHAGGRRLVRECEAADRAPEGADRRRRRARATRPRSRSSSASSSWIKDEDYPDQPRYGSPRSRRSTSRAWSAAIPVRAARPSCPGRAEAKIDLRLVPDMTKDEAVSKLKAHLAKRGFGDIEVNVSGGYGPTETDENSLLIQAQSSDAEAGGDRIYAVPAARPGSWPGVIFTGPPLKHAARAVRHRHAAAARMRRTNGILIDSSNPKVAGLRRGDDALRRLSLRAGGRRRRQQTLVRLSAGGRRAVVASAAACPCGSASRPCARLRARAPRPALRSSRPRFSSASDWLVVAASTPAETTLTGRVTTSTAVSATVPTTQPDSRNATGKDQKRLHSCSLAEAA